MMTANRPLSAQSRKAWGSMDYGHDNPMHHTDEDNLPAAMESEIYNPSKSPIPASTISKPPQPQRSCCEMFQHGIRSLWATRQTEATENNQELKIKTTLRELIIYIIFLVILCIMTFGMTSGTMYYFTNVMTNLFINTPAIPAVQSSTYMGINIYTDWFTFATGPLMGGLYWEAWYNQNRNLTTSQKGYIFYENKLLGVPRLRQLRVRNNSCDIPTDFKGTIKLCYAPYSVGVEDQSPFGAINGTPWNYQTSQQLAGETYWGQISTYGAGGFVQDLSMSQADSLIALQDLFANSWVDRGTRVIFIDFTVYNANINLFCVVRLVCEFPATGGIIPSYNFRTVKLLRYVSSMDYFVLACEIIFCLYIIYYIIEEILEIKRLRLSYLKEFWNVLDIVVILIAICCIAFNIYRTISVNNLLEGLLADPNQFCDFDFLSYWQIVFNSALAIMVFFAWIKIFKYISFNKTMTQLSSTLAACAKDLAGFAIMFFIVFLAFAQLGYLIFGTQVVDFSSFETAIFTLFRIILGDFNFQALQQANRILGPAYFILYVFFVFFVLLNMFLAIINDTYSEVKADLATQKNEFEMGDYFKQGAQKMMNKLNLKRDKIIELQKAMKSANVNGDSNIDFEEWRHDLKMRGYAEAEIEAVFAKYDSNGDRNLDQAELKKMQMDLEGQKLALGSEYDEIDRTGGTGGRGGGGYNDDDEDAPGGRCIGGVSNEEFTVLQRRVDRMEHSIGSIVSKIDAVLVKLEAMERAKAKRRETMGKLLDSISESDGSTDEAKRQQMERLVRDELERWDSEATLTGGRGPSPSAAAGGRKGGSPDFMASKP